MCFRRNTVTEVGGGRSSRAEGAETVAAVQGQGEGGLAGVSLWTQWERGLGTSRWAVPCAPPFQSWSPGSSGLSHVTLSTMGIPSSRPCLTPTFSPGGFKHLILPGRLRPAGPNVARLSKPPRRPRKIPVVGTRSHPHGPGALATVGGGPRGASGGITSSARPDTGFPDGSRLYARAQMPPIGASTVHAKTVTSRQTVCSQIIRFITEIWLEAR